MVSQTCDAEANERSDTDLSNLGLIIEPKEFGPALALEEIQSQLASLVEATIGKSVAMDVPLMQASRY